MPKRLDDRPDQTTGFTLIELLAAVAIMAILISVLLPAVAAAREESRSVVCRCNLRQIFIASRMYAYSNRGLGPALGQPYTRQPNWALVVQKYAGVRAISGDRMFRPESILVCPTIQAHYPESMTRTYATNVTGHAGRPEDPDSYDTGSPVHIRMDRIARPSQLPIALDSARIVMIDDGPPSPRTSSVIDFRDDSQVENRVGWFHTNRKVFNAAMYDGSSNSWRILPKGWDRVLP